MAGQNPAPVRTPDQAERAIFDLVAAGVRYLIVAWVAVLPPFMAIAACSFVRNAGT